MPTEQGAQLAIAPRLRGLGGVAAGAHQHQVRRIIRRAAVDEFDDVIYDKVAIGAACFTPPASVATYTCT